MSLDKLKGFIKWFMTCPNGYIFLVPIVFITSCVEYSNPYYFGLFRLNYIRFLSALGITILLLTGYGYKEKSHVEPKEDNHGHNRKLD